MIPLNSPEDWSQLFRQNPALCLIRSTEQTWSRRGRSGNGIRECCHSVFSCSVKYLDLPRRQDHTTVMEPGSHGSCYMTDKARQSVTNSFRHSRLLPHRNTEQSWSLPTGGEGTVFPPTRQWTWVDRTRAAGQYSLLGLLRTRRISEQLGEIKGTVSRDFRFFFMVHFLFAPVNSIRAISIFILCENFL